MRTNLFLTRSQGAGPLAVRPARSSRDNLAAALVGAGTLLLPVAMFLPWYRDVGPDGGTLSAWGGYWFVIAGMLLLSWLAPVWRWAPWQAGRCAGAP